MCLKLMFRNNVKRLRMRSMSSPALKIQAPLICVLSPNKAREKSLPSGGQLPQLDKTSCVHPAVWSPSYFEWLGCLDTRVYAREMRKDHPEYAGLGAMPNSELAIGRLDHQLVACQLR